MHEAQLHQENCFLTLTYDDDHLPYGGSLDRRAFPLFMKRLRSRFPDRRIRYFHCGEYGERTERPHYHSCLFGFDFEDKYSWAVRSGRPAWRSPILESLWSCGQSEIGSVTFESAAYVARYVTKKVTGSAAQQHYERVVLETGEVIHLEPEYVTMSRRPGIGREWYERYKDEVYPADEVVVRGRRMKPPRFYDLVLEVEDAEAFEEIATARKRKRRASEETVERLEARAKFAREKLSFFSERSGV